MVISQSIVHRMSLSFPVSFVRFHPHLSRSNQLTHLFPTIVQQYSADSPELSSSQHPLNVVMKPVAQSKSQSSLTKLPALTGRLKVALPRRRSVASKPRKKQSPDVSPLMGKEGKWGNSGGFAVVSVGMVEIHQPLTYTHSLTRLHLPPLAATCDNFLPPTLPPCLTNKPPKLQKRFSHMTSTLSKIPCEDSLKALLSGEPFMGDVLSSNLEKVKKRCKWVAAVNENSDEEFIEESEPCNGYSVCL